jgi:hypothetical protein
MPCIELHFEVFRDKLIERETGRQSINHQALIFETEEKNIARLTVIFWTLK